ncbi:MAG: peptidase U32 family protein [Erysipelotrichaceae bacterium]
MNMIINLHRLADLVLYKAHGATSVIVSLEAHGVRGGTTFGLSQLPSIVDAIHQEGMQAYVLMNRIYVEEELAGLRLALQQIKTMNVDGIYFGDLGLAYEAKLLGMEDLLIYNPDTLITNSEDVNFYLAQGFKRIVLSKEITLETMLEIGDRAHKPCEVVIHGRLNMMHSKRNLLSNYDAFNNHSLHLDQYARLDLMEEQREERMPIMEDGTGTHVFTGFSLAAFKEVNALLAHGITHLRIDSLFLSLEEQLATLDAYQAVISGEMSGEAVYQHFQQTYPEQAYSDGFMYKETGTTK